MLGDDRGAAQALLGGDVDVAFFGDQRAADDVGGLDLQILLGGERHAVEFAFVLVDVDVDGAELRPDRAATDLEDRILFGADRHIAVFSDEAAFADVLGHRRDGVLARLGQASALRRDVRAVDFVAGRQDGLDVGIDAAVDDAAFGGRHRDVFTVGVRVDDVVHGRDGDVAQSRGGQAADVVGINRDGAFLREDGRRVDERRRGGDVASFGDEAGGRDRRGRRVDGAAGGDVRGVDFVFGGQRRRVARGDAAADDAVRSRQRDVRAFGVRADDAAVFGVHRHLDAPDLGVHDVAVRGGDRRFVGIDDQAVDGAGGDVRFAARVNRDIRHFVIGRDRRVVAGVDGRGDDLFSSQRDIAGNRREGAVARDGDGRDVEVGVLGQEARRVDGRGVDRDGVVLGDERGGSDRRGRRRDGAVGRDRRAVDFVAGRQRRRVGDDGAIGDVAVRGGQRRCCGGDVGIGDTAVRGRQRGRVGRDAGVGDVVFSRQDDGLAVGGDVADVSRGCHRDGVVGRGGQSVDVVGRGGDVAVRREGAVYDARRRGGDIGVLRDQVGRDDGRCGGGGDVAVFGDERGGHDRVGRRRDSIGGRGRRAVDFVAGREFGGVGRVHVAVDDVVRRVQRDDRAVGGRVGDVVADRQRDGVTVDVGVGDVVFSRHVDDRAAGRQAVDVGRVDRRIDGGREGAVGDGRRFGGDVAGLRDQIGRDDGRRRRGVDIGVLGDERGGRDRVGGGVDGVDRRDRRAVDFFRRRQRGRGGRVDFGVRDAAVRSFRDDGAGGGQHGHVVQVLGGGGGVTRESRHVEAVDIGGVDGGVDITDGGRVDDAVFGGDRRIFRGADGFDAGRVAGGGDRRVLVGVGGRVDDVELVFGRDFDMAEFRLRVDTGDVFAGGGQLDVAFFTDVGAGGDALRRDDDVADGGDRDVVQFAVVGVDGDIGFAVLRDRDGADHGAFRRRQDDVAVFGGVFAADDPGAFRRDGVDRGVGDILAGRDGQAVEFAVGALHDHGVGGRQVAGGDGAVGGDDDIGGRRVNGGDGAVGGGDRGGLNRCDRAVRDVAVFGGQRNVQAVGVGVRDVVRSRDFDVGIGLGDQAVDVIGSGGDVAGRREGTVGDGRRIDGDGAGLRDGAGRVDGRKGRQRDIAVLGDERGGRDRVGRRRDGVGRRDVRAVDFVAGRQRDRVRRRDVGVGDVVFSRQFDDRAVGREAVDVGRVDRHVAGGREGAVRDGFRFGGDVAGLRDQVGRGDGRRRRGADVAVFGDERGGRDRVGSSHDGVGRRDVRAVDFLAGGQGGDTGGGDAAVDDAAGQREDRDVRAVGVGVRDVVQGSDGDVGAGGDEAADGVGGNHRDIAGRREGAVGERRGISLDGTGLSDSAGGVDGGIGVECDVAVLGDERGGRDRVSGSVDGVDRRDVRSVDLVAGRQIRRVGEDGAVDDAAGRRFDRDVHAVDGRIADVAVRCGERDVRAVDVRVDDVGGGRQDDVGGGLGSQAADGLDVGGDSAVGGPFTAVDVLDVGRRDGASRGDINAVHIREVIQRDVRAGVDRRIGDFFTGQSDVISRRE